jgi:DNA-damage-inducible protein J
MPVSNINVRVDSDVKSTSTEILNSLGLDMTTAINIYLRQIIEFNGLPFPVQKKFNRETEEAIAEAHKIASGEMKAKTYSNVEDMFNDILSEDDDE